MDVGTFGWHFHGHRFDTGLLVRFHIESSLHDIRCWTSLFYVLVPGPCHGHGQSIGFRNLLCECFRDANQLSGSSRWQQFNLNDRIGVYGHTYRGHDDIRSRALQPRSALCWCDWPLVFQTKTQGSSSGWIGHAQPIRELHSIPNVVEQPGTTGR